jgi:hypothetical protein
MALSGFKNYSMHIYYFLYLLIFLVVLGLFVRYILWRRTSISTQLFSKGIIAENGGLYDEAAANYEKALSGLKKGWFQRSLEIKIREKLKLLHTISTYERDQHFIRRNNP